MHGGRRFLGQIAVELGYIMPEELEVAIELQGQSRSLGRVRSLGEILIERGFLTAAEIETVLALQKVESEGERSCRLGDLIVLNELASQEQVDECLAIQKDLAEGSGRQVPLANILLEKGYLQQQEMNALLRLQERLPHTPLQDPEPRLDEPIDRDADPDGPSASPLELTPRPGTLPQPEIFENERYCAECRSIMLRQATRCRECQTKYCTDCGAPIGRVVSDRCADGCAATAS